MITLKDISFKYKNSARKYAIKQVNTTIKSGEIVLLCGESGSGKTTFSRLINGLIPNFYEGDLSGTINMKGKDITQTELYDLAPFIGSVFQDPKSQFYTVNTDTEIVFACENLGMEKRDILKRFEHAVNNMQIEKLIGKSLFALSGGEKQKIACASVDALSPDIFVLDEPTSNLDISAINDLRNILFFWKSKGKTVIIAEHRLAWLKGIVDRALYFKDGNILQDIPAEMFWQKSAEEFKKMSLRAITDFVPQKNNALDEAKIIQGKDIQVKIKGEPILDIPLFEVPKAKVIAILGNNGSGKTTFARWLCGLIKKQKGTLLYEDKIFDSKKRLDLCYMVMQDVNHQLFSESVAREVVLGNEKGLEENFDFVEDTLRELDLFSQKNEHPMSLSGGQKQRVAISAAIASNKEIIIFDEPTSGLDYLHMKQVAKNIKLLSKKGKTQFIITHDRELVEACCDYFLFFEEGKIIKHGAWIKEHTSLIAKYFGA